MADHIMLKIKLKSLAEEARIIRKQERKMRGPNWGPQSEKYRNHRLNTVRTEARNTNIAYGLLRGWPYTKIEGQAKSAPDWKKVFGMVQRYGTQEQVSELREWLNKSSPSIQSSNAA